MKKITAVLLTITFLLSAFCIPALAEIPAFGENTTFENTYVNTGNQREDVVKVALTQVGFHEGKNNDNKFGIWYGAGMNHQSWCAIFVSWCVRQAGISKDVVPSFASCTLGGMSWFKAHHQWRGSDYRPIRGDIVFFDWDHSGDADHVGIVEYVRGDIIGTLEGNAPDPDGVEEDCVRRRTHTAEDIIGYGTPDYSYREVTEEVNYTVTGQRAGTWLTGGESLEYVGYDVIPWNTELYVSDISGGWGKVSYHGNIGWVDMNELTFIYRGPTGYVASDTLSGGLEGSKPFTIWIQPYANAFGHEYTNITLYLESPTRQLYSYDMGTQTDITLSLDPERFEEGVWRYYAKITNAYATYSGAEKSGETLSFSVLPYRWEGYTLQKMGDRFTARISNVYAGKSLAAGEEETVTGVSGEDSAPDWEFLLQTDGSYAIRQTETGEYLAVDGVYPVAGAAVVTAVPEETIPDSMRWYLYHSALGYALRPKCSATLALDLTMQPTENGTIPVISLKQHAKTDSQCFMIEKDTVTVSYDAGAEVRFPYSQTKTSGTPLTLLKASPAREGYRFLGWSTDSAAVSPEYFPGSAFEKDTDTQLYAVWQAADTADYAVIYDANSGNTAPQMQIVPKASAVAICAEIPQRAGYTFAGWSESADAPTVSYQPGDSLTADDNVRLYAVWEPESNQIQFDFCGGEGEQTDFVKPYDAAFSLADVQPRRAGYALAGWATAPDDVYFQYAPDEAYEVNSDVTLYAVWRHSLSAGDVNMDGQINSSDALLVLQSAVGKITLSDAQQSLADYNGDGKADATDALRILQFAVGKIS